jgi:hypothetical protein
LLVQPSYAAGLVEPNPRRSQNLMQVNDLPVARRMIFSASGLPAA